MPGTLKLTYIGHKRKIQKRFAGCITELKFNGPPDCWIPVPTPEEPKAGKWVPAKDGTPGSSVLLLYPDANQIANAAAAENRGELAAGRNPRWLIEEVQDQVSPNWKTAAFDPAGLKSHEAKSRK